MRKNILAHTITPQRAGCLHKNSKLMSEYLAQHNDPEHRPYTCGTPRKGPASPEFGLACPEMRTKAALLAVRKGSEVRCIWMRAYCGRFGLRARRRWRFRWSPRA